MSEQAYEAVYQRSLDDPNGFWGEIAEDIHWDKKWDKVLDDSNAPFYRWFMGGVLNTCYNALDLHVERGRAEQLALVYDSPVTGSVKRYTYTELRDEVARFAGSLRAQGVEQGDRVIIYMPMVPEAVVAMLACARIGAIHSVVFGGFAPKELATRIDDAKPKLIVSASCGIEPARVVEYKPLLDRAIELSSHKPRGCVVLQRPQAPAPLEAGRDHDWEELVAGAQPVECVPVAATDPLYILYTSGTTGQPKGIVRDNGGHAVALKWSMKSVYDTDAGDVYWAASDVGWVVGHSYIVYAPLLKGCTTVLYEGKPVGTPDPGAFWRVIADHGVKALFTAPTAFRAIKKEDPDGEHIRRYDLSRFETLFLAGERCDPDTLVWAEEKLERPVIDHWWQTETGWAIAANCIGIERFPVKPGSATKPAPGYDVQFLDEAGQPVPPTEIGNIAVRLPLPPGCLPTLWGSDERFRESYLARYPGYYLTGDAGYRDEDGYLWIMTRTDDVINVAGHRLSTGAMEEVLAAHPDVAECAVVGVADSLKGQVPLGFVVLKAGVEREHADIVRELVASVRDTMGPVAAFKQAAVVQRLPKTRSGKILRGTMQKIADGNPYTTPPTIDDPAILGEISESLEQIGYPAQADG
ncbi:MAG: propionyl-CoA synthetase [Gammaproteobacteria bacterium]|nr:propionyl-CoA synthetase [Gammaproteobacteria bacterium]NIR82059.1 propionyl-CoA synthetase [Gammaproteobacteria bacterium]NIR89287.1 propionyl-CoA synthetase [Gammaproteobacteria bacterium]NIU03169.1 propionyl-CoA synthetase [Gammaproteobacteria bacterium]NIV50685.1 acetate--CoA ligase [Gammaproteobacteria bacterium]